MILINFALNLLPIRYYSVNLAKYLYDLNNHLFLFILNF